jgi:DNA-binding transcriptional MocR family regulator
MDDEGAVETQLIKCLSGRKNAFFFTMPIYSFPTGVTTSLARKKSIMKICANANVPIIEIDDYHAYDFNAPPTYYSLCEGRNVIYIGSFSRTLAFGTPISWIVLPFRLVKLLNDIKFQHNWGMDMYMQMLINETLKDGSYYQYLEKLRVYVQERALFTQRLIKRHLSKFVKIISSLHPMAHWVQLPVSNEQLMKHNNVLSLAMGLIYSPKASHHIVISKVYPRRDDYEKGMILLRGLINRSLGRHQN